MWIVPTGFCVHSNRDRPDIEGTSQLSPHLHFGEISPRTLWQSVKTEKNLDAGQAEAFLRQLGWREFGYYLLYHFPHTVDKPLHEKFQAMPWLKNEDGLHAWQKGLTGYPIVDAGMRQLWKTGWMHNRVRMIVGSFLVKDLLIHWIEGAQWFWDTLVDADLANNTLGWQWIEERILQHCALYKVDHAVTIKQVSLQVVAIAVENINNRVVGGGNVKGKRIALGYKLPHLSRNDGKLTIGLGSIAIIYRQLGPG